jgi:hypothetical protein
MVTIEISAYHPLDIEPPESIVPGEMHVIDPGTVFKIILYTAIVIRDCRVRGRQTAAGNLVLHFTNIVSYRLKGDIFYQFIIIKISHCVRNNNT